jgi:hypothetical protein
MSCVFEDELVEIYEREIEKLAETEGKYQSMIGMTEIAAVIRAFRFALEHGVDKVSAQMLYDMINDGSGE